MFVCEYSSEHNLQHDHTEFEICPSGSVLAAFTPVGSFSLTECLCLPFCARIYSSTVWPASVRDVCQKQIGENAWDN